MCLYTKYLRWLCEIAPALTKSLKTMLKFCNKIKNTQTVSEIIIFFLRAEFVYYEQNMISISNVNKFFDAIFTMRVLETIIL